ncbi:MAG: dinitrogenase iron-molybdenum cofactor biosynthesis protein [Acidobacteria bacterium]|jgi:predicted Fe-Mo cluster-binding NifX family protein|nr:dinitrogenase iron-molybdenum cofactor biosynthesis protein [Acidobacteriota bacterium]
MSDVGERPAVRGCVAVAVVEGSDLSAVVGTHFGRSPRFLLVRGSGEKVQVLDNSRAEAAQGAGPATASLLVRNGVTAVVAGQFGPKAEDALRTGGILPVVVTPGTKVEEALAGLSPAMLQAAD